MKNTITKKSIFELVETSVIVVVGNALLAFFVAAFVIPHDIIMGGTTGIGIVLNRSFSIDTALLIFVINNVLLIFGGFILGKKFFLSTVASSVLYPVFLAIMQRIPGITAMTDNSLLAALFGGCVEGLSIGMLMRIGSSTGGMDIVNLVLNKWFHLPVAVFVSITDVLVVGGQALFAKPEQLLLAIITIVCETMVIDQVMVLGKAQMQVYVISDQYEALRQKFLKEVHIGVTMTLIETGLFRQQQKGLLCVVSPRKLYAVTEMIQSVDPDAFITITKINEVRGRGFTLQRLTKDAPEETDENNEER